MNLNIPEHSNQVKQKSALSWQLRCIILLIAVAIVISRRPDVVFNAQFYAEDGRVWYADAYNLGVIPSLFLPYAGYLTTIQRLGAAVSQIFPFFWAPLVFNLIAIVIQILPVILITSSRFSVLIPNQNTRLFLAFVYLALPNSTEIHANLSNTQWHLAILAYMVVAATPSLELVWRCFDLGVILLSAVSGPFCLFLAPLTAIRWWLRRERWLLFLLAGLSMGILLQGTTIFTSSSSTLERVPIPLGIALGSLTKIIAGQVFLGSLVGKTGYAEIVPSYLWNSLLFILVAIAGILALGYALLKSPLELRLLIVFGMLNLSTALAVQAIRAADPLPIWEAMKSPTIGQRYYFIPMIAFLTTIVWLISRQNPPQLRLAATIALTSLLIGITLDWRHPAFTDLNFPDYANQLAASPTGAKVIIPINPPGWSMELIKH